MKTKLGRPTSYKPEFCEQAAFLCGLGAIDTDLSVFFKVTSDTIYAWKRQHPEFSESLKAAKNNLDAKVEHSLFERAVGVQVEGKQGVYSVPPDTTACIFWLKNRRKEQWRDVQRIEHTGKDGEQLFPSLNELKTELMKRGAVDAGGRIIMENNHDS